MLRPMNDYVSVKTDADEKVSKGGIILPNSDQVQKMFGVIIALPDPVPSFMKGIKIGDRVAFANGSRHVLEKDSITGVENCFVPYYDLLCVIEE